MAIKGAESRFPFHHVKRSSFLRAGFGKDQGSGSKVESRQADFPSQWSVGLTPLKPARNHQVDDKEVVVIKSEDDLLSKATDRSNFLSNEGSRRRIDRSKNKRARDPNPRERLIQDAGLERFDVDNDVR